MSNPCIICVAITGSVPTKKDNPAVPITVTEQIESTHAAFEAGASIAHCHVRNDDQTPTSDPEKFARLTERLRIHCPGMIVQLSTGGRSGNGRERGDMLSIAPDMASLSVGSNNFPNRVYENSPELINSSNSVSASKPMPSQSDTERSLRSNTTPSISGSDTSTSAVLMTGEKKK